MTAIVHHDRPLWYPPLTQEDVSAALAYAAELIRERTAELHAVA